MTVQDKCTIADQTSQQSAYLRKLQTPEYITAIFKGDVDPDKERPLFLDEILKIVLRIEKAARLKGNLHSVETLIDNCKVISPAFAALCEGPKKEESKKSKIKIISNEVIMPALEWGLLPKEMGDNISPWFNEGMRFMEKWSPRAAPIQQKGVLLWVLSTVAACRVVTSYGGPVPPMLYVVLVARSTVYAKTTTAKIGTGLLKAANLHWLLGSSTPTPEKFLSDMAGCRVPTNYAELPLAQQEFVRKRLAHSGQVGWYYSEFGQMLREMADNKGRNAVFRSILQRLHDGEEDLSPDTLSRGREIIEYPYLSLLATMTPDCMKPYSGQNAQSWGDGSYPRYSFAVPPYNQKKTRDDLMSERFPDEERLFPAFLVNTLMALNDRLGMRECRIEESRGSKGDIKGYEIARGDFPQTILSFDPGVKNALDDYGDSLALCAQDFGFSQFDACYGRTKDKALSIATLMAMLEGSRTINMHHLAFAEHIAEEFRLGLHNIDMFLKHNTATSEKDRTKEDVIAYLRTQEKSQTANEIRVSSRKWRLIDADEFEKLVKSLVKDGEIAPVKRMVGDKSRAERYEVIKR